MTGQHVCPKPLIATGSAPPQPDWTCRMCGRIWREWNGGGTGAFRWWAEVGGPTVDDSNSAGRVVGEE